MPCSWRMRRASSGGVAAGSVLGGVVVAGQGRRGGGRRAAVARSWSSRGRSIPRHRRSRRRSRSANVVAARASSWVTCRRACTESGPPCYPGPVPKPRAPPSSASARSTFAKQIGITEAEVACRARSLPRSTTPDSRSRDVDGVCLYDIESNTVGDLVGGARRSTDVRFFSTHSHGGGAYCAVVRHAAAALAAGHASVVLDIPRAESRPSLVVRQGHTRRAAARGRRSRRASTASTSGRCRSAWCRRCRRWRSSRAATCSTTAPPTTTSARSPAPMRSHAVRNPHALMREPHDARRPPRVALRRRAAPAARLLSSRPTAAAPWSLTTAERARDLRQRPAHVRRVASSASARRITIRTTGSRFDRRRWMSARRRAPVGHMPASRPDDVDAAMLYDHFTPMVLLALEDWGFCAARRERRVRRRRRACAGPTARLPVNTHGGQLSEAFIHGYNNLTEAVRQLRGTSTCQVPDAELVLVAAASSDPYGRCPRLASERDMPCAAAARTRIPTRSEFWDGCRRHELRLQRCADCGAHRFTPRPACPWCGSLRFALDHVRAAARPSHSWTVIHRPDAARLPGRSCRTPPGVVGARGGRVAGRPDPRLRAADDRAPACRVARRVRRRRRRRLAAALAASRDARHRRGRGGVARSRFSRRRRRDGDVVGRAGDRRRARRRDASSRRATSTASCASTATRSGNTTCRASAASRTWASTAQCRRDSGGAPALLAWRRWRSPGLASVSALPSRAATASRARCRPPAAEAAWLARLQRLSEADVARTTLAHRRAALRSRARWCAVRSARRITERRARTSPEPIRRVDLAAPAARRVRVRGHCGRARAPSRAAHPRLDAGRRSRRSARHPSDWLAASPLEQIARG